MLRKAEAFRIDTSPDACSMGWHQHLDWRGWGNTSWKLRREHLRAFAIMFRHIHDSRNLVQVPFQAWIGLNGDNSRYDAVCLESPGTDGATFPWKPPGTEWEDGAALLQVSTLLPGIRLRVGLQRWMCDGENGVSVPETTYFIYSSDVGSRSSRASRWLTVALPSAPTAAVPTKRIGALAFVRIRSR